MKPKILFVTEKWPQNNPALGQSSLFVTLFKSLSETGLAEMAIGHPDEWWLLRGEPFDYELLTEVAVLNTRPDIIIYSWLSCHTGEPELFGRFNPQLRTWHRIKTIAPTVRLCAIWGDSAWALSHQAINVLAPIFDLHLTLDVKHNTVPEDKFMALWGYPYSKDIFTGSPTDARFIDVSFVGSVSNRPERQKALSELKERGINVQHFGGQAEDRLSFDEYATIFKQSKITLNFSQGTSKGRAKEALLCGACLVEPETAITNIWVEPGKDYVTYKMNDKEPDYDDLAKQISYYLANSEDRIAIATHGYNTVHEKYNSQMWWEAVFTKLGFGEEVPDSDQGVNFDQLTLDRLFTR